MTDIELRKQLLSWLVTAYDPAMNRALVVDVDPSLVGTSEGEFAALAGIVALLGLVPQGTSELDLVKGSTSLDIQYGFLTSFASLALTMASVRESLPATATTPDLNTTTNTTGPPPPTQAQQVLSSLQERSKSHMRVLQSVAKESVKVFSSEPPQLFPFSLGGGQKNKTPSGPVPSTTAVESLIADARAKELRAQEQTAANQEKSFDPQEPLGDLPERTKASLTRLSSAVSEFVAMHKNDVASWTFSVEEDPSKLGPVVSEVVNVADPMESLAKSSLALVTAVESLESLDDRRVFVQAVDARKEFGDEAVSRLEHTSAVLRNAAQA